MSQLGHGHQGVFISGFKIFTPLESEFTRLQSPIFLYKYDHFPIPDIEDQTAPLTRF